jgi:hypothetical protein
MFIALVDYRTSLAGTQEAIQYAKQLVLDKISSGNVIICAVQDDLTELHRCIALLVIFMLLIV